LSALTAVIVVQSIELERDYPGSTDLLQQTGLVERSRNLRRILTKSGTIATRFGTIEVYDTLIISLEYAIG
jgi:hypothetical protein